MKYAALLCCLALVGCSGSYHLIRQGDKPSASTEILSRYLDRSGGWESFSSHVKVKVEIGDSSFSAKGILFYTSPEKYSLSFSRPYNQVLGDVYVTPDQLLYWGNGRSQMIFSASDTVHTPELLFMALPDWDPRDLLPFPISGRTTGFQVVGENSDSLGHRWVLGECGPAKHELMLDSGRGTISDEFVTRHGTESVRKHYERIYSVRGWPISTRVICSSASGDIRLTWALSKLVLKGADYITSIEEPSQQPPR